MPIKKRASVRLSPERELSLKLTAMWAGNILDPQGARHLQIDSGTAIILLYPEADEKEHPAKYIGPFDSGKEAHDWAKEFLSGRKFLVVPVEDAYDYETGNR